MKNTIFYYWGVFIVLQLTLNIQISFAQENYTLSKTFRNANAHWFKDGSAGGIMLNFMKFPPEVIELPNVRHPRLNSRGQLSYSSHKIAVGESGSGVSDTATGKLLFYSSGKYIYNQFHEVMPNSQNLKIISARTSTMQQVNIVPFINDPNRFHLFCLMPSESSDSIWYPTLYDSQLTGLYHYVVDMRLDSGRGDIDTAFKNNHLHKESLHESMISISGNNCDIWLIVKGRFDNNFYTYHITENGVNPLPVISAPRSGFNKNNFHYKLGRMSASPLRNKIAFSNIDFGSFFYLLNDTISDGLMLADFDPENGKLSNGIKVDDYVFAFSHVFSSDGTKIYTNSIDGLYQYDISSGTQIAITNSKYLIAPTSMSGNEGLRRRGDTIYTTYGNFISNPNGSQSQCGYNISPKFIDVQEGSGWSWGADAVYPLPATHLTHHSEIKVCYYASKISLKATSGYHTYRWNNNDALTDSVLSITEPGTYWVEYTKNCHTGIDTFHVTLIDFEQPVINVNDNILSTIHDYETYQWLLEGALIENATQSTYRVIENGRYQVVVSDGLHCVDTSDEYVVNNANSIENLNESNAFVAYPNPAEQTIQFTIINGFNDATIKLIDVVGKTVLVVENLSGKAFQVDLQKIPSGMYIAEVHDLDKVYRQNIIKR